MEKESVKNMINLKNLFKMYCNIIVPKFLRPKLGTHKNCFTKMEIGCQYYAAGVMLQFFVFYTLTEGSFGTVKL